MIKHLSGIPTDNHFANIVFYFRLSKKSKINTEVESFAIKLTNNIAAIYVKIFD